MKHFFNATYLKVTRRKLRKDQTEVEKLLWQRLRNKQLQRLKFFRQYSIGSYILDFYCPEKHLAIELDGSQHLEQGEYDAERDTFLKSRNIHTLRFWNNEVLENIEGVLEKIAQELEVK